VYNKKQRNGVFCFLLVLVLLQLIYVFVAKNAKPYLIDDTELIKLRSQIDSLKSLKKNLVKVYKFNPNFITDEKGYALGMSVLEIDRLLAYRSKNKWVNSTNDFQKVTKVSDSLIHTMSPFFQFPKHTKVKKPKKVSASKKHVVIVKKDINKATAAQLKKIYGIGGKLSVRVIKYGIRLQGYTYMSQLDEVYGLKGEALENVKLNYKVIKPPVIEKLDVNTATFKEVLSIVYIDYETTKLIFQYKNFVNQIQKLEEIKKIEGFPIDKYDRIALYLRAG
jgi:DNA uptake protein ComE-like DNA-binding protein